MRPVEQTRKLGKACLLGFFLAFLCLQRQINFQSQEGHPSSEVLWAIGEKGQGDSQERFLASVFSDSFSLKYFMS